MNGKMEGSGQYRGELAVPEEDIDRNGHVNDVCYIQWMQEVAVLHSEDSGSSGVMESRRHMGREVPQDRVPETGRPSAIPEAESDCFRIIAG
jgi:hypothetical protein